MNETTACMIQFRLSTNTFEISSKGGECWPTSMFLVNMNWLTNTVFSSMDGVYH